MDNFVNDDIINACIDYTRKTMRENIGGPFGAVILDKNGKLITIASNSVLASHDATAHAEVNAIRQAGKILGTYDLSDCVLYATGYPCPMCLGAIIWSNIKEVYFGCTPKDADDIGFRDDYIYDFINDGRKNAHVLQLKPYGREKCLQLFAEYADKDKIIY